SLLRSAGQTLVPQWTSGFVPAEVSTTVLKPSQSGSLEVGAAGGRVREGFGEFGQLSAAFMTASQSRSPGQGAQERGKRAVSLVISKMSMSPSGGSGAIFWRTGPGGTETPQLAVTGVMSKISAYWSLLRSAGQAL